MNASVDFDHCLPASWRAAPRTFVSLMTLYESNYVRWRQLVSDPQLLAGESLSKPRDDCALRLRVEERGRYTTTVSLTYLFEQDGVVVSDPDLLVRIYHDARLVEAMRFAREHRHRMLHALEVAARSELNARWRRNTMLNKWLEYCIERGHRFQSSGDATRTRDDG